MRSSEPARDAGAVDVVCLRPEEDFLRVGVSPPPELSVAYRSAADADVRPLLHGARALLLASYGPALDERLLDDTPRLRLIQFTGAGTDRVSAEAARRRGVEIGNVSGTNATTVAQYVAGTAIVMLRRLPEADAEVRAGRYADVRSALVAGGALRDLSDLTVGVVGMGSIGLAVAAAFRALEPSCRVVYHDPAVREPERAAALGAVPAGLPELLRSADVVTVHVPLVPSTRGLIGRDEIAAMKGDALLVQASRGGVVDESALADALAEGRLGGAVVDVYEGEPPPPTGPLLSLRGAAARRVLFTPHIGGVARQSEQRQFTAAWRNVERALRASDAPRSSVSQRDEPKSFA